jgi:DNA-binding NtrC family response regulator
LADSKLPEGSMPLNEVMGLPLKLVERILIEKTLEMHGGSKLATCKTLGICIRTLRNKLNKYKSDDALDQSVFPIAA